MPRKKTLLPYTVVVDTNVLFAKKPADVVSPGFCAKWQECCELAAPSLVVPEVVKGERLYQLVVIAEKAVQNAAIDFDIISKVSGRTMPRLPSTEELRADVEVKFTKWMTEHKATLAPTPCDKVDWKRVVNDSIWRVRPFVPAAENEDSEKGFRDCLLLETLRAILRAGGERKIVFISRDTVLREAATVNLDSEVFSAYEDMNGFISHIKLTQMKLKQDFVNALMQKIPSVFYAARDPDCVFLKFKVRDLINKQFSAALDNLHDEQHKFTEVQNRILKKIYDVSTLFGTAGDSFEPASLEQVIFDTTEFLESTSQDVYHWRTRVRFARLFRKKSAVPQLSDCLGNRIRIAVFEVFWRATIDNDGEILNTGVEDIKLEERKTEDALHSKLKSHFYCDQPSDDLLEFI